MEISTGKNISFFSKGDIITRVTRVVLHTEETENILGIKVLQETTDGSYRGDPMEYIGIANNMIYLKALDGILRNSLIDLPLERWADGWEIYINPNEL